VDAVQCQVTLNNERQPVWCDSGQQKVLQRPDVSLEEKTHNQKVAKETLQTLSSKAWAVTEIALYGQKTILRHAVQKGYVKRLEMKREGCKIVGDLVISNAFPKLFFFFGSSSSQNCRIIRAGYNLRPPYYDSQ
jgi:hypothetical protein